jgi:hypothetical protein
VTVGPFEQGNRFASQSNFSQRNAFGEPVLEPTDAIKRSLSPTVAEASPGLYAAGARVNLTREERNLIEGWSAIKTTHEKLMLMDNDKAAKAYKDLDPDWQAMLFQYYKVDYGNKAHKNLIVEDPAKRKLLGIDNGLSVGDVFKSPFRFLFAASEQYYELYNTPYRMAQESTINRESFWTRGNFEASFDGDFNYDNRELEKLTNKHGRELSFAAMHLLAGKTPGQIIDAWGPNDGAILEAVNQVFNDPDKVSSVMDEFDRARLSPGRNVARWVNKSLGIEAEENQTLFRVGSGAIDFAFQIFADPLTYLTAGASNIGKANRLTKALLTSRNAVEYFANPAAAKYFAGYGEKIGEYRKAMDAKDAVTAGRLKQEISNKYKDHGTDQEIDFWAQKGVTDYDSFKDQFLNPESQHFSMLVQGRVSGVAYSRETASVARPGRELSLRVKEKIKNTFLGKPRWDELDEVETQKLLSNLTEKNANLTDVERTIQETASKGLAKLKKQIEYQFSLHPGYKRVFVTDDKVVETLETVRQQANLAFKDKTLAHLYTEHFRTATQEQRITLKRNLDELIIRSTGILGLSGGKEYLKRQLDFHYGGGPSYTASGALPHPAHFGDSGVSTDVLGPLGPAQMKDAIGGLDYRKISEFVAAGQIRQAKEGGKLDVNAAAKLIGGTYNSKAVGDFIDFWSLGTLFPQLGVRTAIDEGFFFALTARLPILKEFFRAQGYGNVLTAYTGSKAGTGAVKNVLQSTVGNLIGKEIGALRAISQKQRDEIYDTKNENALKFANDAEAEDWARNKIADLAINTKYGNKLDDQEKSYLKNLMRFNPNSMADTSALKIVDATLNQQAIRGDTRIISKSNLDKSLEEAGMTSTGDYTLRKIRDITDDVELDTLMFHNFITGFSQDAFKFGADPAAIFIANNGLRTPKDVNNAVNQFLKATGFVFNGSIWQVNNKKVGDVKRFIDSTTHMQKFDGLSDVEKVARFAKDLFADLYVRFHGDIDNYNDALVKVFQPFINGYVKDHRQILKMMDKKNDFLHPSGNIKVPSYSSLVKNHRPKEEIISDLDFEYGLVSNYRKYGDRMYEMMSRATDDIYRNSSVQAHYMVYRKQDAATEAAMKKDVQGRLISQGMEPGKAAKIATEQSEEFFTNRALTRATNQVLKFADNPDMRTVFAYNVRTVGRFYRAVEDFHRRMYRLVKDNKLSTVYRMRLMTTGLNSFGDVHEDQDGQKYAVLPMDDVIYGAVNGTLQMLTNGKVGVGQPLFNDITFNVTAMNPSFQTDAGVPYLSGPAGSLSIWAIKSLLGGVDPIANQVEDLDQWTLGTMGDNVNFRNAVVPRFVNNVWKMLSPDERDQQEVSAYVQAIAYNQANGLGIDPADYAGNTAGLDKAKREYLHDLKISAHNIIVTRILLGMVLPVSVQTKDTKDLPTYLKENGVVSMKSSFYEVYDEIKLKYPDVENHYELTLATWTGKNPGKIAYIVSTNQEGIKPIIDYSNEMQDWAISNREDIAKYGVGALIFAPNSGEFSPGVYKWAESAGIVNRIPEDKTLSKYIDDYFDKVTLQAYANAYYDIEDEEAEDLRGIPFTNADTRRSALAFYQRKRDQFMLEVPGLDQYIRQGVDNTDAAEFVDSAYNYVNSPNAAVKPEVKDKINQAYTVYNNFITRANQIDAMDPSGAADFKRAEKKRAIEEIQAIIDSDPTKTVEQYFKNGLLKMMSAKSRDAQPGILRNIIKRVGN